MYINCPDDFDRDERERVFRCVEARLRALGVVTMPVLDEWRIEAPNESGTPEKVERRRAELQRHLRDECGFVGVTVTLA